MKTMTLSETLDYLKNSDGYLLLTHIRPDGDTLGSAAALCHILRRMGKTAYLFDNPQTTSNYAPFVAPYIAPADFRPDTVLAVDLAAVNLYPQGFAPRRIDLCIDHHPTNTGYAKRLLCQPDRAACGEIILQLAQALELMDAETATLLYIAVATDCGCFVYANTNADTHIAAAELIRAGADYKRVNKLFFRTFSYSRLRLEGMLYAGLRRYGPGDCVTVATLTMQMMADAGADEDDCEDIASLAGKVAGSRVSVTIREMKPGLSKLSLRSGEDFDSSAICALHGGGGHKMAAGCTIKAGPEDARDIIVRDILEAL